MNLGYALSVYRPQTSKNKLLKLNIIVYTKVYKVLWYSSFGTYEHMLPENIIKSFRTVTKKEYEEVIADAL